MDNQDFFLLALEGVAVLLLISLFLMRFALAQKQKISHQAEKLQQAQQQQKKQAQQLKALMDGAGGQKSQGYDEFLIERLATLVEPGDDVELSLVEELSAKALPELVSEQKQALQRLYLELELALSQTAEEAEQGELIQLKLQELFDRSLALWWPLYRDELIRTPSEQAIADVSEREVASEADLGMSLDEAATLLASYTQESQQMLSVIKDLELQVEDLQQQLDLA